MDNTSIALAVMAELAGKESSVSSRWKWAKGVVLFPQARCPFCKTVVNSKAIWVVSETALIGQVIPTHGVDLVLDKPGHPHCDVKGAICFGNAYSALQALFGGLNPASEYAAWPVAEWLQGKYWCHSCSELETHIERRGLTKCSQCEDGISENDSYSFNDSTYCRDCYNEVAFNCYNCGNDYPVDDRYMGSDEYDYCESCFDSRFFRCSGCSETFRLDADMGDSECEDCYSPPTETCETCGEEFTEGGECSESDHEVCDFSDCVADYRSGLTDAHCDDCERDYCTTHIDDHNCGD